MILEKIDGFLKCDFHMHSGSCYSRNYSNEDFIKTLEKVELDCISITDHNIIDVDLYKRIKSNKKINKLLIGGIELNIRISDEEIEKFKLEINTDVEYFHGILLFDYKNIETVWKKLFNNLILKSYTEITKDMSISEISSGLEGKSFILSDIQAELKDIEYYFIFHENKGDRNLSDYLKNGVEANETYKEKLFYYNDIYAVEGNKRNQGLCSLLSKELNIIVSRFFFSDAKKLQDIGAKYTWINFDGEFSNLILPFSDPEVRIFTSDLSSTNPQKNSNYLSQLKMDLIDKNTNKKEEIILYFSPGLNGIIGARGSGKSMLGNILAGKETDKYSDYLDISSIEYKMKDCEFTKNIPKTKYLKQNELLKIYEEEHFSELDFIKETYKNILEEKKANIEKTIIDINTNLENEKSCIIEFYEKYNNIIFWDFLKNKQCSSKLLRTINKNNFKKNKEEYENVLNVLRQIKENIETQTAQIKKLEFSNAYPESEELYKKIEKLKENSVKEFNSIIEEMEETIKFFESKDETIFENRQELINLFFTLITQFNSQIDNNASKQNENIKLLSEFLKDVYLLRKKLTCSYKDNNEKYQQIFKNQYNKKLKLNEESSIILKTKVEEEQKYEDIIKEQIKIENTEYSQYILDIIFSFNEFDKFKSKFNGVKFRNTNTFEEYIQKFFGNIEKRISSYNNIGLEILYNGKELSKYSPGKRSEILLEIFLHYEIFDNNDYEYIILDQPEDNLDTNTIVNILVNKIREMKLKKQLFIISHSAPVIINSDSNIIICSEQTNNRIYYNSGNINDKKLKEKIVTILDGGEKNLKMRLNKYNFTYKGE